MFSWQAIRITCMILLALPRVHPVVLMSSDVAATLNNEPTVWAEEIEDYRQQDMAGKPEAAYFRSDGTNLNEHGYLRLSTLIQNEVDKTALQP